MRSYRFILLNIIMNTSYDINIINTFAWNFDTCHNNILTFKNYFAYTIYCKIPYWYEIYVL